MWPCHFVVIASLIIKIALGHPPKIAYVAMSSIASFLINPCSSSIQETSEVSVLSVKKDMFGLELMQYNI